MSTELLPSRGVDQQEQLQMELCPEALAFQGDTGSADMLSQSVREYFRCSQDFLSFSLSGELSRDEGYFRFGQNVICYGRSSQGTRQRQVAPSLYDARDAVVMDNGQLKLPFDPTQVISNLRLERYANRGAGDFGSLLKKTYYLLRPLTSLSLRRRVQRLHSRNWEKRLFPHWPVDTTVESICETLLLLSMQAKGVDRVPFVWFWPRGARGCVVMTHDVETEAGRDFCPELMDMDDAFGIKASFQIVPEQRYEVPAHFLDAIRSRGFDIGIQDLNHDGRLFDNREEFLRRAAMVNRYAIQYAAKGFRAGVLYRRPEWYEDLNFSFDMSIPNVAHLDPQRGGCCTVMPYFIGNVLELPVTTTQDYMLFHLLNEQSIDLWKTQIELILQKNGLVSFIVHPDYVMEDDARSTYRQLLEHLQDLRQAVKPWFALPTEVDSWWRARSQMSVEREGNAWRITGEGADRAVLAYAKNVNGQLVYELAEPTGTGRAASTSTR